MDTLNQWLLQVAETLPGFINSLSDPSKTGKFIPCLNGVTKIGREASLGFSCFALKQYFILGLWNNLEKEYQDKWINFIKSFQNPQVILGGQNFENAFVDPVLLHHAYDYFHHPRQLTYHLSMQLKDTKNLILPKYIRQNLTNPIKVIIAETKQAIATLMEIGAKPDAPFLSFPQTPDKIIEELSRLNWYEPWAAGGQAASLAVFIATQLPLLPETATKENLVVTYNEFLNSLVDPVSGTYYRGDIPGYGQSINGAMKVLTALDWLQIPIHYPQSLIDTCLSQLPSPEGCYLVDAVYVLYRCLMCTNHRKSEVISYLHTLMDLIKLHYNPDGGFSYYINRSQTSYYNIRISRGLPESDLHGTLLLTWAIAMILEIIEGNMLGWRVLKP